MNSPDFALDKWGYAPTDVNSLMSRVSSDDLDLKEELEITLQAGGGKAFGLKICELVASNFFHLPHRMIVPKWDVLKDIRLIEHNFGSVLRSSAPLEDWLNSDSGVLPSFTHDLLDIAKFNWLKRENALPDVPYIKQEHREGLGLVLDVGYSHLERKILMRIAAGNERFPDGLPSTRQHGIFTSATNDTEASAGVWDAETGEPVLPTRNFGHRSLNKENAVYYNILARPLLKALRKTGIDFGVQMEIIEHPDQGSVLNIVQIRPTPARVCRPIFDSKSPFQQEKEKIIARSAIVNGVFDITGEVLFFGNDGIKNNYESRRWGKERLMEGKIGIYDETTGKDYACNLQYSMAAEVYYGGYLAGCDAQLTPVAIRPNTHHGSMSNPPHLEEVYQLLDQNCGMVSLRSSEIDKIQALAKQSDKPLKLRIVSDGLIAQVRTIK